MAVALPNGEPLEEAFEFKIPPEAPTFQPTHEEFKDPLLYINKIRPIAEMTGICKIKPPSDWQPPFAVDIEKFKFTPRVQRLNELEAKTRIKLNFLDQIAKFWELQGSSLKIPMVERRILDLYTLHQTVQEEGGAGIVTRDRKWPRVATKMGFPNGKGIGALLKSHYDKILYPFEVFQQSKISEIKTEKCTTPKPQMSNEDQGETTLHRILQKTSSAERKSIRRNNCIGDDTKRVEKVDLDLSKADNKELKRLQFYGAGPKMPGFSNKKEEKQANKTRTKKTFIDYDPLAKYVCRHCQRGDIEESMLLCDGCDDSYHTFCLVPPLFEIPKGDWRCPRCVAQEVNKPTEAFGFEQAQREYTLHQFGEMADQFKSDYFNMPVHKVPTDVVEKEFWRIVSSLDEDVTVEYGADLHTVDHGSGFPTKSSATASDNPVITQYAESSWNLNNLPVLEGSVLSYINADISGMKVPWMYVGMCFATFCWHNEDHWSYSINYLHWGEPKTWYGVPGTSAEDFEVTMKKAAPELFHSQPDLLHQLVTIMNPNLLMDAGVPVYRTDQHAGEFVITFPRAYHAGFNQGYNFAEAVNFAPADWLKMGRECISHYSSLHRYCVFSHDELVCKMAVSSDSLDPRIAAATYQDMLQMVDSEKKLRKSLLEWGVCDAEREAFELLPDDERQCDVCKTTCFLSAVTCKCEDPSPLVCLRHYAYLCHCPPKKKTLRYRYTLDELPVMLQKVKLKAESFDKWVMTVKDALDCTTPKTLDLDDLRALLHEAEEKKFPESELLRALGLAIQEAEKCSTVARQLENSRVRTRTRVCHECKLTAEELYLFYEQIEGLACKIKEAASIRSLVNETRRFEQSLKKVFTAPTVSLPHLKTLLNKAAELNIDFKDLDKLKAKVEEGSWISKAESVLALEEINFPDLEDVLGQIPNIPNSPQFMEAHTKITGLISACKEWEKGASDSLSGDATVDGLKQLIKDGENLKVKLATLPALKEVLYEAESWEISANAFRESPSILTLTIAKDMINRKKSIPVTLPALEFFENLVQKAESWLKCAEEIFLLDSSKVTLLEVLCPRIDSRNELQDRKVLNIRKVPHLLRDEMVSAADIATVYNDAEKEEIFNMKQVQLSNIHKKLNLSRESFFCICRSTLNGNMVECSLCRDWFHESCVPYLQSIKDKTDDFGCDIKFTCGFCARSKRPTVEFILSLLLSLNTIKLRIPEGEALRYLMDRIVSWQEDVKRALNTEEMLRALNILEKRKKKLIQVNAVVPEPAPTEASALQEPVGADVKSPPSDVASAEPKEYLQSEHTYSNVSKVPPPRKHHRKSPIIPRRASEDEDEIPISLSKAGILTIKELLNAGGLIEADLEEGQQLWCLLQSSVPHQVWKDFGTFQVDNNLKSSEIGDSDGSDSLSPVRKKPMIKRENKGQTKLSTRARKETKEKKSLKEKIKSKICPKVTKEAKATKRKKDDDSDDSCAAPKCLHPVGPKVDWVQCDGSCNRWFHMFCMGIQKKEIKKDDEYICASCKDGSPTKKKLKKKKETKIARNLKSESKKLKVKILNHPKNKKKPELETTPAKPASQ